MRRYRSREGRDEDEADEYEGGRTRGFRRDYDDTERDFINRSRRRDEGEYGRAYGGGYRGERFEPEEPERVGGGHGPRRARMGWGRWEEDEGSERRRMGVGERDYGGPYRRGEFGGSDEYRRGREDERYGVPRGYDEDYGVGNFRGEPSDVGRGRRPGRFEEEDQYPRGQRGFGGGQRFGGRREDEFEGRGSRYVGGRHQGGNIGQSQMDYDTEGFQSGTRSRSRWEDEDVVTTGRGDRGGRFGRRGTTGTFEQEDEGGRGRRTGTTTARRGKTTGRARTTKGKASQRKRSSLGVGRLGAGARKKTRIKSEEDEETGG
jgi:hypothetical protein